VLFSFILNIKEIYRKSVIVQNRLESQKKLKNFIQKELFFRNLTLFKLYIICYNIIEYE